MVGELITLPVRIGVHATRLWLRAAEETVSIATSATGRLIGLASGGRGESTTQASSPPDRNGRSTPDLYAEPPGDTRGGTATTDEISRPAEPPRQPATPPPAPSPTPSIDLDAPPEREPVHVSEEPALVEEFAEPGAEDGAGPEIHIEEPWEGYGEMTAKEVVARLGSATPAELAAVQLYEGSHRRRQTILNAVQRELRNTNGRSS
jgi:hypothetical protein